MKNFASLLSSLSKCFLAVPIALALASDTSAQNVAASAQLSGQPGSPGQYDYTITLFNAGTLPIQTFWYSWVPGADFLPSMPTSAHAPTGWFASIQGGGYYNGYSIEFLTPSTPLAPGGQINFTFSSPDSPATLSGTSPFYIYYPVGTSFAYSGIGQSGSSAQFVVQTVVPEPSAPALWLAGVLGLGLVRGLKSRAVSGVPVLAQVRR